MNPLHVSLGLAIAMSACAGPPQPVLPKPLVSESADYEIVRTTFPDGRTRTESGYRDGVRHGPFVALNRAGDRIEAGRYVTGEQHGTWRTWHDNGQPASRAVFDHGAQVGRMRFWQDNGKELVDTWGQEGCGF